jgi:hypothetical protein
MGISKKYQYDVWFEFDDPNPFSHWARRCYWKGSVTRYPIGEHIKIIAGKENDFGFLFKEEIETFHDTDRDKVITWVNQKEDEYKCEIHFMD